MIIELTYWFHFFLWAFFVACFLNMWNDSIKGDNNILSWYRWRLIHRALRRADKKLYDKVLQTPILVMPEESEKSFQQRKKQLLNSKVEHYAQLFIFWEKPMGLCPICLSPYISIPIFFLCGLQSYFANGWWCYTLPLWFAFVVTFLFQKLNK